MPTLYFFMGSRYGEDTEITKAISDIVAAEVRRRFLANIMVLVRLVTSAAKLLGQAPAANRLACKVATSYGSPEPMIQSIFAAAAHRRRRPASGVGLAASCLAFLFFLLLPLVGGCKTGQESATKSSRLASVVIKGRSAAEVSVAAERVFTGSGYQAAPAKSAHMVFEKQGSAANTLVYGDWSGKPVWFRVKVYLRDLGASGILLDCDAYRVLERGDVHFEEEHKLTRVHRGTYQELMDKVSQGLP